MKKMLLIFAALFSFIFMLGCGEDGQPGQAYLSFDWDYYVDWYEDNNSNVPYTIYPNTDYNVEPGTYSYEYGCSDGYGNVWGFYGTYTITVNPGEEGSMFSDGNDGADKFYEFILTGYGPYMQKLSADKVKKQFLNQEYNDSGFEKSNVGEVETTTIQYKYGTIVITRQAVQWIKK